MASSKGYLEFILDQLSELDDIRCRTMMGEFIIYYRGRIIGGIYDDRFLVKPTKASMAMMVDNVDNKDFLKELLEAMVQDLPVPGKKKQNRI